MHSTRTQRKFIQLRSQGLSLARIAEQIGVSKTTLVNWNRWFDEEIEDLTKLRDTLETELSGRPLSDLPIEKLFLLSAKLREQILAAYNHGQLLEKQIPSVPDGLTRRERRRNNMNELRVLTGLNPIDEDGNEYELPSKSKKRLSSESTSTPSPDSVNKQTTSPENPSNP